MAYAKSRFSHDAAYFIVQDFAFSLKDNAII